MISSERRGICNGNMSTKNAVVEFALFMAG